jgi:hypothetical protein
MLSSYLSRGLLNKILYVFLLSDILSHKHEPSQPKLIGTMYDYEVHGMILLQAYLYAHSLLRGVTFEVLPLSSYALSPTMLLLLETFLILLLWISFQCRHHVF